MADHTILDAPETPAPVFAFRALKGAIFGSPDNDDERMHTDNTSREIPVHSLRSKISSLRVPSLSPSKRRKTNQYASPGKSILRTPGLPTPQRPTANVTFKDVTPSLSPECTRRNLTPSEELLRQYVKSTTVQTKPYTAPPRQPFFRRTLVTASRPAKETNAALSDRTSQAVTSNFDAEAYRLSTEKEMKKLVRYGQQMREYARKQDEENTKLRLALHDLRRENEELRQRERVRDHVSHGRKDEHTSERETIRPSRRIQAGMREVEERDVTESAMRSRDWVERPLLGLKSGAAGALAMQNREPLTYYEAPSPLKRKATAQLNPEPRRSQRFGSPDESERRAISRSSDKKKDAPMSGPVGARLPVERVAAARERIRLKAELRRGSNGCQDIQTSQLGRSMKAPVMNMM